MGVLREVWYNVNFDRKTIATMREQPVFKTPPQRKTVLRDFDAPVNVGNKYVQRLTSYLQVNPPLTVKNVPTNVVNEKCGFFFYFSLACENALTSEYCHYC